MSEQLHYAKAPIMEATIDLQVMLPNGPILDQLELLLKELSVQFPENQKLFASELFVRVGEDPLAETRQRHIGYRLVSADKHKIVQIRTNGFSFSIQHPYDRWEPFRDEARSLWNMYRTTLTPNNVTRIAVRNINRLDIPLASVELKNYLRTVPEVSGDLPQMLISYFMQLVIPKEDIKSIAIINQTIAPPPNQDTTSVILDIDLFREAEIPIDEDGVWTLFEQLRDGKNLIFKACITPEMEALIS